MHFNIQNSLVEGEHKLSQAHSVRLSYSRLTLLLLSCLLSCLLLAFFFRWFPETILDFIYIPCSLDKATHFKVAPYTTICRKQEVKGKVKFQFRFLNYLFVENQFVPLEYDHETMKAKSVVERRDDFGRAQMIIPMIGFLEFTAKELSTPFYTLQYICVVVWLIQGFFYFAIVMMSCSLISTFIKFYLLRRSLLKLQQLAAINQEVQVLRNEQEHALHVDDLVPGDVIKLSRCTVPSDCILQGQALVNEATLTGESNPVPKLTGAVLYEGTKIISNQDGATALVIRTNYSTVRGQYFRNVLYPHQVTHKFYTQALKFLVGFVIFNIVIAGATIYIYLDFSTQLIITNVVGTLTWIFPPAMPIFFSITATVGLLRLHQVQIIGSNMDKIHISGQVDAVCFDKTGTLTTNELSVIQLWEIKDCQMIISCCHHLIQSNNQIYGDVLDIEMVKYSKAEIDFVSNQVTCQGRTYKIVKIFEFNSELMCMSVIVEWNGVNYICTKGAPEKLKVTNGSVGQEQLQKFVNQGFRVISLAFRELHKEELAADRSILEQGLTFSGYLVFENKLKQDTAAVMKQLLASRLRCKILSGDNPLTTVNTAFEIGLAESIELIDIQEGRLKKTTIRRVNCIQRVEQIVDIDVAEFNLNPSQGYALTGDAMNYLMLKSFREQSKLCTQAVVFARVKPHQKKEVVHSLQQSGHCVAMIGDGSNDCSAIAQADIGVSFSQADASYTAHFSSLTQSIDCIVKILSQGRATAQTLSEIFPLYLELSFLASIAYTCIAVEGQNYSDFQLLYISFLCYLPIMYSMTMAKAVSQLPPVLPLDDMYSAANQLSLYAQLVVLSGGLVATVVSIIRHENHVNRKPEPPIEDYVRVGLLNSVTVILALAYSIYIPLCLYVSKPFKESMLRNYLFMALITISTATTLMYLYWDSTHPFLGLVDFNQEMEHFDIYFGLIIFGTLSLDYSLQHLIKLKFPKIRTL